MGATKLQSFDLEEEYRIFAVHTALPGFRLAFLFNQLCEAQFVMSRSGFSPSKDALISVFEFDDDEHQVVWRIVENRYEIMSSPEGANLFLNDSPQTKFLIPEHNKANFLLKLEGETFDNTAEKWLNRIKSSLHIQSAYEISLDKIKKNSKKNLIF